MYEVVGHEDVRAELAEWVHPFVIVGPEGVGRNGIRLEKYHKLRFNGTGSEGLVVPHFHFFQPSVTYVDSDSLLKFVTMYDSAVSTTPIAGIRNFYVGALTDQNVSDILRRDFPQVMSRALVVSILDGTFQRFAEIHWLVEAFEQVSTLLTTHAVPHTTSRYVMEATTQACLSRLGAGKWAFNSPMIMSTIPEFLALWYLAASPTEASTTQFYYGIRDGFVD